MTSAGFHLVDVFTDASFAGNPVAVIETDALDERRMQAIAAWFGMPETVFLTAPTQAGADYAVRIFSPQRELPFAGHPSIGACHVVVESRRSNGPATLVQACPAGLFDMAVEEHAQAREISFRVRPRGVRALQRDVMDGLADALGRRPDQAFLAEAGARWITAWYDDPTALEAAVPRAETIVGLSDRFGVLGITAFAASSDPAARFELRSFAPALGVLEDAVCGGGNACVAATVSHQAGCAPQSADYCALQGRHVGRNGKIRVSGPDAAGFLSVGGRCVTTATGVIAV